MVLITNPTGFSSLSNGGGTATSLSEKQGLLELSTGRCCFNFDLFVRLYNCVGKTREWSYKLFGSMMSLTSRYDNTVYFYSLGMIFKSNSDQNSFYD